MSKTGAQLRREGPFPEHTDPWAEVGHYFHQIHGGMIGNLLRQVQDLLDEKGYIAGHLLSDGLYTKTDLPFPTLLTNQQRADALAAVEAWKNALKAAV